MNTKNLIIDNVGYDVSAMATMSKKAFVETHLPNDAIGKRLSETERRKLLEDHYNMIRQAAGNSPTTGETVE
jgi:hypothetical protein